MTTEPADRERLDQLMDGLGRVYLVTAAPFAVTYFVLSLGLTHSANLGNGLFVIVFFAVVIAAAVIDWRATWRPSKVVASRLLVGSVALGAVVALIAAQLS